MSEQPPPETSTPQPPQGQYPPPAQWPPYPGYWAGYPPATDNQAIAALVCAVVAVPAGLFCYGVPGVALGLIGFFLGRNSEKRIRLSQGRLTGEGMAKGAWITGIVSAVFSAFWMVAMIGFVAFFIAAGSRGVFSSPSPTP